MEKELNERSGGKCELCGSTENLKVYTILPTKNRGLDENIFTCSTCFDQLENPEKIVANHWRCLNDSIWSEYIPVRVVAWRILSKLKTEDWAIKLLEQMYLDEETLAWAESFGNESEVNSKIEHRDANGVLLNSGDTVVLIKDLKVKGSSMVAKQGTAVRNIRLDHENQEYIEGKVDGQQIVIITQYVKKA